MRLNGIWLSFVAMAAITVAFFTFGAGAIAQDATVAAAGGDKPYRVDADGTVSWPVFSGFRRFNSECFVCHGPDASGSSFAPALVDSLKTMTYEQFLDTVTNGKQEVNTAVQKKMPAFGTNPNVMCFIDDIYAYVKARSDGVLGRGRPAKHDAKSAEAKQAEDSCIGS